MASTEREITIYARVGDTHGLNAADAMEQHEQWEMKLPEVDGKKRRQRIRQTTAGDVTKYDETIKVDIDGETAVQSTIEETSDITEEYFRVWKEHLGQKGSLKTRYTFHAKSVTVKIGGEETQIPDIKYEVDILRRPDGIRSRWCKIDVEIDSLLDFLDRKGISFDDVDMVVKVTHLPFKPEQCFLANDGISQHEESIKAFWEAFNLPKAVNNNNQQ